MTSIFQFDAFISYNRADGSFARSLQKALEHFAVPRSVRPDRRRLKVFRDTDDMTGTDYDKAIRRHLDASRKLIVICSPQARASQFVNDEIAYFIEGHSPESVIPVLLSGIANNEPGDEKDHAFPQALVDAMRMPLGVDYRNYRGGSLRARPFRNAWYFMLADLLETGRAEIEERDRRNRAARFRAYGGIAAAVLIGASVLVKVWWDERRDREAAQRISRAQEQLQRAVNTEDDRQRALALAGMIDMPEVDGVLEAALSTGMILSSPQVSSLPGDYADLYWNARVDGVPITRVRPLAATSLMEDCEFSLPGTEFVEGLRTPDGSAEIYLYGNGLFVQNTDGLGPALVYCIRLSGFQDQSPGTFRWAEGTETLTGRMAFGMSDLLGPQAMVKDRGSYTLEMASLIRPGKHLMAFGNVAGARFTGPDQLEVTINGLPPQIVRLPAGDTAAPQSNPGRCFSYDGPEKTIGAILEANGIAGYEAREPHPHSQLRACTLDGGRVLAYVTNAFGESSNIGAVVALDAATLEELFFTYTHAESCTAFGSHTLSYCEVGDLSSDNVTKQAGFRRFGEADSAHPLEDETWSRRLTGHALASADGSRIALWGSTWVEDPEKRPVVVWLEALAKPRPIILDPSESPVEQVEFSPDSRFLVVRRQDGTLRLWSFDTRALLESLGARVAPPG